MIGGPFETCLFLCGAPGERRLLGPSEVVERYDTREAATAGHKRWSESQEATLLLHLSGMVH